MSKNHDNNSDSNEENPFSLPEGYFNAFSKKMMLKIELADELKEFKVLSGIDKKLPFVTPENYFSETASATESKAELSAYETLVSIKKQNAFAVPELYFERSAKAIEHKIVLAEELKAYPTLNNIKKENVFGVPQNYFDNVSYSVREQILVSVNSQPVLGRVIQLVFNKRTAYALAAMLVLSLGLYFYTANNEVSGNCNGLACLDKSEILKSSQINNMDEESLMKLVDPEKLSKNLESSETDATKKEEANYVNDNVDINEL